MLARVLRNLRRSPPRRPAPRPGLLHFEPLETREVPAVVYGVTTTNTLIRFDSANPGTIQTTAAITGLQATERVLGIDFRPRTGQLIATTVPTGSIAAATLRTYSVNPLTGVATFIGSTTGIALAGDRYGGYDFNPAVDRIRLAQENAENGRLNPNTGAPAGDDPNLTFTAPATGPIIGLAYDRNTDRANAGLPTTLYGIDRGAGMLVVQGGLNGAGPGGANGGQVTAVGPLGVTLEVGSEAGFDIAESTDNGGLGTALATLFVGGMTRLYSVNLSTGAATLIGTVGGGVAELAGIAIVPDGAVVVGSGLGANGDVRLLDPDTGAIRAAVVPFAGFQGGVRVAAGDVTRDGIPDMIVSADAPQGHVKVFDGVTGAQLGGFIGSFFAFEGFQGTVNITSGDVNGDGFADVIVAANGVNGHMKAFSGADGALLASFLAYPGFGGVTTVAAADFDNDGDDEIVTAAAVNGHVRVFNADGTPFAPPALPGFVNSFFASQGFVGTVFVAAGDVNGDGIADITAVSGAPTFGTTKVFNGPDGALFSTFTPVNVTFGGIPTQIATVGAVGLADVNADGRYEIVLTPAPPGGPFRGTGAVVSAFDAFGVPIGPGIVAFENFLGGATVAGARF